MVSRRVAGAAVSRALSRAPLPFRQVQEMQGRADHSWRGNGTGLDGAGVAPSAATATDTSTPMRGKALEDLKALSL